MKVKDIIESLEDANFKSYISICRPDATRSLYTGILHSGRTMTQDILELEVVRSHIEYNELVIQVRE